MITVDAEFPQLTKIKLFESYANLIFQRTPASSIVLDFIFNLYIFACIRGQKI